MHQYWPPLNEDLKRHSDYETRLNLLRYFTKTYTSEIKKKDLAGEFGLEQVFAELTSLAEAVVQGSLLTAQEELLKKESRPQGEFAMIAMGKFGGHELTYSSDLDIIYLLDQTPTDPKDFEFFTKLGVRILSAMSMLTQEGVAYRLDTALRPSGNAGALITSLPSFIQYHRDLGRTWEKQALIKARPILGTPEFCSTIQDAFYKITYRDYDAQQTAAEIDHLRKRMEIEIARQKPGVFNLKTGRGGIVDIEFAVQYLQLVNGARHPEIRTPSTLQALARLSGSGLLEAPLADELRDAYLFLRLVETRLRLEMDQPTDTLIRGGEWARKVEEKYFPRTDLIGRLTDVRESVRSLYERIFHP